jgi:hypothetical protein
MNEISSTKGEIIENRQVDTELRSQEMETDAELRQIEIEEQKTLSDIQDSVARTNQNIALISSFGGDYANVSAHASDSFQHKLGQLSHAAQILGGSVAIGEIETGGRSLGRLAKSNLGSSDNSGRNFYEAANNQRKVGSNTGAMGTKWSCSAGSVGKVPYVYACPAPENVQSSKKMGGLGEKTSAFDKLSAYMSSHNYGKEDYITYSKDPEWQKLHAVAFPEFHQIADHEFSKVEKIDWINNNVTCESRREAERIVHSMEQYSGNGYDSIHWDTEGRLSSTQDILRVFDSKNIKPYKGVIYRGLSFDSKQDLMKALARGKGDWSEPGITSFSANKTVAEDFACRKKWGLVLTCSNNRSAIPFRHMSLLSWEDEILSPGAHRNSGWEIDMKSVKLDKEKRIVYADISEK